ncbi:MAG: hypothetical protein ACK5PP_14530 [Acidimicrobiales bacterium]
METDPTGPDRAADPEADAAFRRFLERATEDPSVPRLHPRPVLGDDRTPTPGRPPLNRRLMAAAAVILIASLAVAALMRPSGTTLVSEPAASVDRTGPPPSPPDPDATVGGTTATEPVPPEAGVPDAAPPDPTPPGATTPDPTATDAPAADGATNSTGPSGGPATAGGGGSGSTAPAPDGAAPISGARLSLDLSSVPEGAANGRTVTPTVGPSLTVERVGAGTIAASGQGRVFGPGGQQRSDYAIVTRVGADVADLLPATGRASVTFTPRVDVLERSVPTGRNIHTWFQIVSEAGPDQLVTGVSLQVDPEIGPYLSGAIQGTDWEHTLSSAEITELSAGRPATISLTWASGQGRVLLNGGVMTSFPLDPAPVTWRSSARISVGGSATWGAGYFATHDDAIRRFEIVAE